MLGLPPALEDEMGEVFDFDLPFLPLGDVLEAARPAACAGALVLQCLDTTHPPACARCVRSRSSRLLSHTTARRCTPAPSLEEEARYKLIGNEAKVRAQA